MRRMLMLAAALAVVGCTSARWHWAKDGATQADFNRDAYECERDMRQSGYYGYDGSLAGAIIGASEAQAFGERCMVAKGYAKVPG